MSPGQEDTCAKEGTQGLGGTERGHWGRRTVNIKSGNEMCVRGTRCGLSRDLGVPGGQEDISHRVRSKFRNSGVGK